MLKDKEKEEKITDLKIKVEELTKQIEDLNNKWKRALADYQNLEKRTTTEKQETAKYAAEKIIHQLLVVFDTLEAAEKHIKDQGLSLGVQNFWVVLKGNGVRKIEVVGKKFNPHEMECIEVVEGKEDDIVVEEVRAGYRLFDKIIRVAQVKVGKIKVKN